MANVIKHKRGSGSDPVASDLVVGEVAIRTDVGKLFTKMDNGTVAEIAGGGSDIAINTLSSSSATGGGSATFNGSAYRFTLSAPPSVSAQQLLVSINGVIQKPVAGTGQPSEGFSVDGTDIILGDAPATGSDFFILTFKSLGVSEPADNSVTSAKIVDGAIVNADINASAAIAGSKIDPSFTSNITVSGTDPRIIFTDTNNNPDFTLHANGGEMQVENSGSGTQVKLESSGSTRVFGNLIANANLTVDTNTLHVDSSNNRVGIGTTSPDRLLHVVGSDCRIKLSDSDVSADVELQNSSGNGVLTTNGATNLIFMNNNTERMRIDTNGNVGIGTSTINDDVDHCKLAISGQSGTAAGVLIFQDTSNNEDGMVFADDGNLFIVADRANATSNSSIRFRVDGSSEKMRIDSSGQVGINETNPQARLHVGGDLFFTGGCNIEGGSSASNLTISGGSTFKGGRIILGGGNADDDIRFSTSGASTSNTERMRIDSSGNVSIGTTSPSGKLDIQTGTNGNVLIDAEGGSNANHARIINDSGDLRIGANNTSGDTKLTSQRHIHFLTGSSETERMRIDSSGNLLFNRTETTISSSSHGFVLLEENNNSVFFLHSREANGTHNTAEFYGLQGAFKILGDGDVQNTNNSYGQLSDVTLKQDIVDASSQWDDIKAIRVRKFRFKNNPTGDLQIGVVAQELETVSPKLITEVATSSIDTNSTERVKAVKYSVLYMKAIKALQEAQTRIETLETKVTALEAK